MNTTYRLPEAHEWTGTDAWSDHLAGHGDHFTLIPDPTCPSCIVVPMLKAIHASDHKYSDEVWALQDGYGEPGFTPCQGWDWSGIRDSSPAATARMYAAVRALEEG